MVANVLLIYHQRLSQGDSRLIRSQRIDSGFLLHPLSHPVSSLIPHRWSLSFIDTGSRLGSTSVSAWSSSLTLFLEAKMEATFPLLVPGPSLLLLGGVSRISMTSCLGDDLLLLLCDALRDVVASPGHWRSRWRLMSASGIWRLQIGQATYSGQTSVLDMDREGRSIYLYLLPC